MSGNSKCPKCGAPQQNENGTWLHIEQGVWCEFAAGLRSANRELVADHERMARKAERAEAALQEILTFKGRSAGASTVTMQRIAAEALEADDE